MIAGWGDISPPGGNSQPRPVAALPEAALPGPSLFFTRQTARAGPRAISRFPETFCQLLPEPQSLRTLSDNDGTGISGLCYGSPMGVIIMVTARCRGLFPGSRLTCQLGDRTRPGDAGLPQPRWTAPYALA